MPTYSPSGSELRKSSINQSISVSRYRRVGDITVVSDRLALRTRLPGASYLCVRPLPKHAFRLSGKGDDVETHEVFRRLGCNKDYLIFASATVRYAISLMALSLRSAPVVCHLSVAKYNSVVDSGFSSDNICLVVSLCVVGNLATHDIPPRFFITLYAPQRHITNATLFRQWRKATYLPPKDRASAFDRQPAAIAKSVIRTSLSGIR